jgi:hypothetical protein
MCKICTFLQNKLHHAVSGHTASEIIFNRANAELPFMGLTVFRGRRPVKSEVTVAKNYMTEKELFALRRMVNAFFDMAELKAETHQKHHFPACAFSQKAVLFT